MRQQNTELSSKFHVVLQEKQYIPWIGTRDILFILPVRRRDKLFIPPVRRNSISFGLEQGNKH